LPIISGITPPPAILVTKYAGVDLSTLGVECEVLEGVESSPPIRGSGNTMNLVIPYQHGQRWVPKYYDERPIVLKGLMIPTAAGNFMYSTDALRQLFPIGAGEQKLEVSRPDGSTRYIMAEVRNTLGIARDASLSPAASKFSIELAASDPFWYGDLNAAPPNLGAGAWTFDSGVNFDDGAHWFDSPGSALFAQTLGQQATVVGVRNAGVAATRKAVISLSATSMANPKITNLTNGYSVQMVNTGQSERFIASVVFDCGLQKVTMNGIPVPTSLIVLGSGQTDWLRLEPGDNALLIDLGLPGGGTFQVTFNAAYL